MTTDGSITDIPREDYVEAEERVVAELKAINKPFVILLNTQYPDKPETEELRSYLEAQYGVPVLAVNCAALTENEINTIMRRVLFRFPIREISVVMPKWIDVLEDDHWLKKGIYDCILSSMSDLYRIDSLEHLKALAGAYEYIKSAEITEIDLGTGTATLTLSTPDGLFYQIVKESSGFDIDGEDKLMSLLSEMAEIKREYDKISFALHEVRQKGYGIVTPTIDELHLEEPEIVKQGSRFGVKLKASAPSIHMICSKQRFLKAA